MIDYELIGKTIEWHLKENGYVDIYDFKELNDLIEIYVEAIKEETK